MNYETGEETKWRMIKSMRKEYEWKEMWVKVQIIKTKREFKWDFQSCSLLKVLKTTQYLS